MGGDDVRTRVVIVVRDDTARAKFASKAVPTDKIRVRGIAYTAQVSHRLSILVDSAGAAEG